MTAITSISLHTVLLVLFGLSGIYFAREEAVTCKPADDAGQGQPVQAGFYTPARTGKMWDTWVYYHDGKYYMYYLAGSGGHWDGHELAISEDGVHWAEHGVMIKPRAGVKWMGTGHIWKSPDFAGTGIWVMNYSEWFGD